MFKIVESFLLTLWIGSMWTVGYLVAPVLFSQLDDRIIAGMLAGKMFSLVSYAGLISASILLIAQLLRHGLPSRQYWLSGVLIIMLALICVGEFVLQPQMAALKAAGLAGENMTQFSRVHGMASILYLLNSVMGLILIARWHRA